MSNVRAVAVDRHYDHIGTTLESGEEVDPGLDTMMVAISDVLPSFYQNLLCGLQLEQIMPRRKGDTWSSYNVRTIRL
jgi:hypothetical protein